MKWKFKKVVNRLPREVKRTLIIAGASLCVCIYIIVTLYAFVFARHYIAPRENTRSDFFTNTAITQYLEEISESEHFSRRMDSAVRDYTPRVDQDVTVGQTITVKITVAPGAIPHCFFQNAPVPLTRNGREDPEQDAVYTGTLTVPEEAQGGVFGAIEFIVRQNGYSEIITAAVLCDPVAMQVAKDKTPEPLQNEDGTYQLLELLEDAETYDGQSENNKNTALSPYPGGTVDYICGESRYADSDGNGYRFLLLGSGRRVCVETQTSTGDRAVEVRYFDEKKRSENSLHFDRTHVTAQKTEIYLNMDWEVPVNVSLQPQLYFAGYQNRPYNVERFSATYIDILFHYTKQPRGVPAIEDSALFTKAEWVKSSEGQPVLRLHLAKPSEFAGYELRYTSDGQLCLSFRHLPTIQKSDDSDKYSLKGVKISVDAGHGGKSPGAVATLNGEEVLEKDHTRKISDQLIQILKALGATVLDVRPGDTQMNQYERSQSTLAFDPDLFISIHLNADGNNTSGAEGYYYYSFSQPLAKFLYQALDKVYPEAMGYQPPERTMRIRYYPFAVTRVTAYPAVLMELGYMDNSKELEKLCDPATQKKLAQALANGIIDYLK